MSYFMRILITKIHYFINLELKECYNVLNLNILQLESGNILFSCIYVFFMFKCFNLLKSAIGTIT